MRVGDLFALPLGRGYKPAGEPRQLTTGRTDSGGMALDAGGRGILTFRYHDGLPGFWKIGTGSPARRAPVPLEIARTSGLSVSAQAHRLVYSQVSHDPSIWRLDLVQGGQPVEWIASTKRDEEPAYSPAGDRIVFVSGRTGHPELWLARADGTGLVQRTSFGGPLVGRPAWRPDGRAIGSSGQQGGLRVRIEIDAGRGPPRRSNPLIEPNATWSRDGQWRYFARFKLGWNVFKAPTTNGDIVQVTRLAGAGAQESPDGNYLYYAKRLDLGPDYPSEPNALWRMPLEGGEGRAEEVASSLFSLRTFTVSAGGAYFIGAAQRGGYPLQFFDAASRRISTSHTLSRPPAGGTSLSPDGRYLPWSQAGNSGSDLWLVENFR